MSSNMRWVVLVYGICAVIATYLVNKLTEGLFALTGWTDPLAGIIPLHTIVGLVGGIAVFLVLMKHPKITPFALDVVKEIKKVTWPTIPETRAATLVVIVLVLIISLILGLFDYIFANLTSLIYS